jgi:hypothetical protein
MKRFRLSKIVLDEISLCDVGANSGAKVVLMKRLEPSNVLQFPVRKGVNMNLQMMDDATSESVAIAKLVSGDELRLLRKCLDAVSNEAVDGLRKSDFENSLSELAQGYSEKHNIGYHQAYAAVLKTTIGKALYDGYSWCER